MNPEDFLEGVIRPTLQILSNEYPKMRNDEYVELLLLGTAIQESRLKYLFQNDGDDDQYDGGLGLYQIEEDTHEDIWDHYLAYRSDLASAVRGLASQKTFTSSNHNLNQELVTNLAYATAIARLVYFRKPDPIPETLEEQAEYWKKHYNTHLGRGEADEYKMNFYKLTGRMEL